MYGGWQGGGGWKAFWVDSSIYQNKKFHASDNNDPVFAGWGLTVK